jgi:hypothetical protein
LTAILNREPLGSAAFTEETAGRGRLKANLGDASVRPGQNNRLTLEVKASMPGICVDDDQAWVLIQDESQISLAHLTDAGVRLDLDRFPYPFHLDPMLKDVLLALPDAPTDRELATAFQTAAMLGDAASGNTILPVIARSSDLPAEDMVRYHVIAIGRPSRNTVIQQVNDQLPQPFIPGTDEIEQRIDDVVLRLSAGTELGYLQLMVSPWDESHALLAITGTTDGSIAWARRTLQNHPFGFRGNLVLVRADSMNAIDTRELLRGSVAASVATAVPEMAPVASKSSATSTAAVQSAGQTPGSSPAPQSPGRPQTGRPAWLVPLLAVNGGLVVGILAAAGWKARQKRL